MYSFFLLNFSFHFSLSVSSTGTDFLVNLVWLWILFWFNFLFCVIRRNIGDWIHATFLRKKSRHFNALNFIHKKVNRFYCPRTQTMTRGIWSCTVKIDYEVNWFNSQKKFCRLIHIWLINDGSDKIFHWIIFLSGFYYVLEIKPCNKKTKTYRTNYWPKRSGTYMKEH